MDARTDPFAVAAAEERWAMVRGIVAGGALGDPAWRAAFEQVPRHLFVPYYFAGDFVGDERGRLWCEDPDPGRRTRWLRGAYADTPLAIRIRDGELISSSSQPSLMARMLEELDVRDGQRVLEIGTGSGYNAALLAHRLGDDAVTTIDLDPEITEAARRHLDAAGHHPAVVTGDGARGWPPRGPYDRIIATCTLPCVPWPWLEQCVPGARILAPFATGLIVLHVREGPHGKCAEGRFLHTAAYFVPLRGLPARTAVRGPRLAGVPRHIGENDLFRFLLALTGEALDPREALSLWRRERRPGRERFGITLADGRQWAWLDDPAGPYAWPLSSV
ncbi:methyltransferase domain-containing protein [Streptomyces sp. NPDC057499]|uniref:methyltransferase domain-containing protein n=1 Tax=Streptomyces sp. NPDC057499 TaxID=3346150 RepID=UPI003675284C